MRVSVALGPAGAAGAAEGASEGLSAKALVVSVAEAWALRLRDLVEEEIVYLDVMRVCWRVSMIVEGVKLRVGNRTVVGRAWRRREDC